MNTSTVFRSALLTSLFFLGACTGPSNGTSDTTSSSSSSISVTSSSAQTSDVSTTITVSAPVPNAKISSPFMVNGQARGNWYFEASFPVHLFDANGVEIAVTPAQAQADWMTEDFVPFAATLTFSHPSTLTGTLVLENDNPSGDPARMMQVRIPVRF